MPPTATPIPPSVAILGTWTEVSYNGQSLPASSADRLTFWTRRVANTSPRPVDRWGGIYRLLPNSRIAFRTAPAHWVAHYSIFDPDLETDVSGQRSVWQRTH